MQLFFALFLLLQEESAEETFAKIEETFQKAKTAEWDVAVHLVQKKGQDELRRKEGSCLILLKEGNKVNVLLQESKDGQKGKTTSIVSDGKTSLATSGSKRIQKSETHALLCTNVSTLWLRHGSMSEIWTKTPLAEDDFRKTLQITNCKAGGSDGGARTLSYTFQVKIFTINAKLWYSPSDFKPVKRQMDFKDPTGSEWTVTEEFKKCVFGEDIPDDRFKLPNDE